MNVHAKTDPDDLMGSFRFYAGKALAAGHNATDAAAMAKEMVALDQAFQGEAIDMINQAILRDHVGGLVGRMFSRKTEQGEVNTSLVSLSWSSDLTQIDVDDFRPAGTVSCSLVAADGANAVKYADAIREAIANAAGIPLDGITFTDYDPFTETANAFQFSIDASWHDRPTAMKRIA